MRGVKPLEVSDTTGTAGGFLFRRPENSSALANAGDTGSRASAVGMDAIQAGRPSFAQGLRAPLFRQR